MKKIFLIALLGLAAAPSHAAKYTIDKAHSSVNFTIRHLVSKVKGSFTDFSGTIIFDEKFPDKASVEAVIQAASINTNNGMRDKHLKSPDFFDVEKFPVITFKSSKVASAGKGKFRAVGTLAMHGVEKPAALDVDFAGEARPKPEGEIRAGFSAKTTIPRQEFGIVYNQTLESGGVMLGEDVVVDIEIEALKAP